MAEEKPLGSEAYYIRVFLQKTKIKDVMTQPVIFISMDAPFSQVAEKINGMGIRHLPVVDQDKKLVGLVTQRDLFRIQPPHKLIDGEWHYDKDMLNGIILMRVMTNNPVSLHPEDSVAEALTRMVGGKYGCIPIVDKNNILCGIVTRIDLLKVAARTLED